jgi:hypothetical protein
VPPLPHIGEAIAAFDLAGTLLEGVGIAGGVGLIRRGDAEHPAQIDEVLLRGGSLGAGAPHPLIGKLSRCDCVAQTGSFPAVRQGSDLYPTTRGGQSRASTTVSHQVWGVTRPLVSPALFAGHGMTRGPRQLSPLFPQTAAGGRGAWNAGPAAAADVNYTVSSVSQASTSSKYM